MLNQRAYAPGRPRERLRLYRDDYAALGRAQGPTGPAASRHGRYAESSARQARKSTGGFGEEPVVGLVCDERRRE